MQERIIHSLKSSQEYLSGEEISRSLNISRAGIWKYIQDFRRQGYKIDAIPNRGYRIRSIPDKLLPWEVKFDLGTRTIGREFVFHETLVSTMDEALALAADGAVEGTVVSAETQTQGRGRLGRGWVSPAGKGIYISIVLRPKLPLTETCQLPLVSAVALCEAVNTFVPGTARIKWPNDILINGKKVAGILAELNAEMDRVKFVVVGIGVNVNTLPPQLLAEATSLKAEARGPGRNGRDFSRVKVLQQILRSFEIWYARYQEQGFAPVREAWKAASWTLGRRVRFQEGAATVEAIAVDLAPDGGLMLTKDSGETIKKISGDITVIMDK